jgi:hypothetical protein
MVTTPQTCASNAFVRLDVTKLITYFTLRRRIARVNRPGEGLFTAVSCLVAVSMRVFVYRDFTRERAVDVRGVSRGEDHPNNPPR